jgi:NAD(P) transhydrogenase subunit beta
VTIALAVLGAFIGAVSFSGSLIAFGKLQGLITRSYRFGAQQVVNLALLVVTLALGAWIVVSGHPPLGAVIAFFVSRSRSAC